MLAKPISTEAMTKGIEIIAIVMLVIILKFTRLDIRKMGITKKNLKRALIRAGIISFSISVILILIKFAIKPDQPLFNWDKFDKIYIITSPLQEFLARGFLLTTLILINNSPRSKIVAVICSSLMFTTLHLQYGFVFMVSAGLLSLALSYCYLKDENIWGVSLIHYTLGTIVFILELV